MGGRRKGPTLSSENWQLRFKIVYACSLLLLAVMAAVVFLQWRADMIQMQAAEAALQAMMVDGQDLADGQTGFEEVADGTADV